MKNNYIKAKSQIISEFLVGLSIVFTAGGIALPFVSVDYNVHDLLTTLFAIAGSLISLRIAIEYKKKTV